MTSKEPIFSNVILLPKKQNGLKSNVRRFTSKPNNDKYYKGFSYVTNYVKYKDFTKSKFCAMFSNFLSIIIKNHS